MAWEKNIIIASKFFWIKTIIFFNFLFLNRRPSLRICIINFFCFPSPKMKLTGISHFLDTGTALLSLSGYCFLGNSGKMGDKKKQNNTKWEISWKVLKRANIQDFYWNIFFLWYQMLRTRMSYQGDSCLGWTEEGNTVQRWDKPHPLILQKKYYN